MFDFASFLKDTFSLFAIVEPIGAIPIYLSLTSGYTKSKQLKTAKMATMAGFLILLSALLFGKWFLQLMGISLSSIRVAGGLMFLVMGLQLIVAESNKISESESLEAQNHSDVSVVPLALPILSGPGAMGAVILLGSKTNDLVHFPLVGISIAIVMFISYLCFRLAQPIGNKLGKTGLNILNRISGLVVLSIGVEFVLAGVHEIWIKL
jgi:multiple antibiotic resistance protein